MRVAEIQLKGLKITVNESTGDGWMTIRDDVPSSSLKAANIILDDFGVEDKGIEAPIPVEFNDGVVGIKVHLTRKVLHGVT